MTGVWVDGYDPNVCTELVDVLPATGHPAPREPAVVLCARALPCDVHPSGTMVR